MADHNQPTSEWEHSHALESGDRIVTNDGERWDITDVRPDGSVWAVCVDYDDAESWTEDEVRTALANDELERESDNLSHELATF